MAGTESRQSGHRDQGRRLASRLLLGLCHPGGQPPVGLVYSSCGRIDLDGHHAAAPRSAQRTVESSDSGEEVYESEGLGHYVKLSPPCHFLWEPSSSEWHAFLIQRGVIFGLHMSDKKSGEKLASLLVSYLATHPGSSARQVAVALGVEKSRVNAILYGRKSVFVPEGAHHLSGRLPSWSKPPDRSLEPHHQA